jgi:hypothetical protein
MRSFMVACRTLTKWKTNNTGRLIHLLLIRLSRVYLIICQHYTCMISCVTNLERPFLLQDFSTTWIRRNKWKIVFLQILKEFIWKISDTSTSLLSVKYMSVIYFKKIKQDKQESMRSCLHGSTEATERSLFDGGDDGTRGFPLSACFVPLQPLWRTDITISSKRLSLAKVTARLPNTYEKSG